MAKNVNVCRVVDNDDVMYLEDVCPNGKEDVLLAWIEEDYLGRETICVIPKSLFSSKAKLLIVDGEWTDEGKALLKKPIFIDDFEFQLETLAYRK